MSCPGDQFHPAHGEDPPPYGDAPVEDVPVGCHWGPCEEQAVGQVALRRKNRTWFVSQPYCERHVQAYGNGSQLMVFDGREVLPL